MRRFIAALFAFALLSAPAMATPPVFNGGVISKTMPVFNVLAYGAKGDGTTDDSAAIQSANSAAAAACGTLFFPTTPHFYAYNSASPIVIAPCESVYGIGAILTGQSGATGDGIQYANGNHYTTDFLPIVQHFGGACLHMEPGASTAHIYFSSLSSCGVGIESESNATNSTLDNTITGTMISSNTTGIEITAASSSDVQQGNVFNVNFVDSNKYSLEFYTPSGTAISPSGVNINVFNLIAIDGASVAGSIGVYGVANFAPAINYLNVPSFFGGFAVAPIQINGGNANNIYKQIVQTNHDFDAELSTTGSFTALGSLSFNGGLLTSTVNQTLWVPTSATQPITFVNAANTAVNTTFLDGGGITLSRGNLSISSGNLTASGSLGFNGGTLTATGSQTLWIPASSTQPINFVNAANTAVNVAFPDAGGVNINRGNLSLGSQGAILGAVHLECSSTSGVPCSMTVSCSLSAATSCTVTHAVPASVNCTESANGSDTTTGAEWFKSSLSSTTLTVTGNVASSQTSTVNANVVCE